MTAGRILVINPNSNAAVTHGMDAALSALRLPGGPGIECLTLAEGPFGIETQADIETVVLPLRRVVADSAADAFVIACYSDPGLAACREATAKPVFGIQECAVMAALTRGDRYGVVALSDRSIARQARHARQLGVVGRWAGSRPLGLSVADAERAEAFGRVEATARALVEEDGADVVILGCAGMARHRVRLESVLGVPVIDPVQAATGAALVATLLG